MTLVLGLGVRQFALQVGDRRVTQGTRLHNPMANKSVVAFGYDGFVCISYSGPAYAGQTPTDQWIAETLAERKAQPGIHGGFSTIFGSGRQLSIGLSLQRLDRAIERAFVRDDRYALHLLITGFLGRPTGRGDKVRPMLVKARHRWNGRRWRHEVPLELSRHPALDQGIHHVMGRGAIGQDDREPLERLAQRFNGGSLATSMQARDAFVDTIREVSATNDYVGPDAMTIVLNRWGGCEITFMPDPRLDEAVTAHTPWIVSGGCLVPPQILSGGLPEMMINGHPVHFGRVPPLMETPMKGMTSVRPVPPPRR